jgi:hypothetical protein
MWRKVNPIETRLQAVLYSLFTVKSLWFVPFSARRLKGGRCRSGVDRAELKGKLNSIFSPNKLLQESLARLSQQLSLLSDAPTSSILDQTTINAKHSIALPCDINYNLTVNESGFLSLVYANAIFTN